MPQRRGFTLIELLVVISIIALLSSVVLASINAARDKARIAAGKQFAGTLERSLGDRAVGIWDFDECSGTTAADRSGAANSATLQGGAAFSSDTPISTGCSVSFDGVNDFTAVLQPDVPTAPNLFTVSFWMNPGNQYSRFVTPDSNGIDQWIGYDASNQRIEVQLVEIADINGRARYSAAGSVPVGRWSHVAVSINGLSVKIYVNGSLSGESTETIPIGGWTSVWRIGQRGNSAEWYSGKLDGLRVYAGAL